MCEHGNSIGPVAVSAAQPRTFTLRQPVPADVESSPASAEGGGSRRRRLWDIPRHCHCPLVGVCLPIAVLRRLLDKVLVGKTVASDYELHVGAVSEAGARNKVSDAMQRELERRYEPEIRRFAKARTTEQLEAMWQQAVEEGDVAAALWASLSHARCDAALQETICRDIHMIQHQNGASARADVQRLASLSEENSVLARELGRVQQRSTQFQAERIAECERLNEALMKARAQAISRETLINGLRADNLRLLETTPDLQSRQDLSLRVAELKARVRALEDELEESRRESRKEEDRLSGMAAAAAPAPVPDVEAAVPSLASRSILCVGGRNSQVPIFRDLVERQGGRFAHHDGGIEDNPHRLDASLAAADLVICQTGCLSHNAYWLVKDHCKRHGKRCVYLESASVAGFVRGLALIPVDDSTSSV